MLIKERIMAYLRKHPSTAKEVALACFTVARNAGRVLAALHKEGRIHICGWKQGSSGPAAAVYLTGPGEDVPRPLRATSAERCRAYRTRLREKHGDNYKHVHEAQKQHVPGRQILVGGKVTYQQ